jgi:hypothetical protein
MPTTLRHPSPPVSISRQSCTPLPGTPWLVNVWPATLGKRLLVGSLSGFVLGAIGGGHGMEPAVAWFLLLVGLTGTIRGMTLWASGSIVCLTTQICPECLTSMARGSAVCTSCTFRPPQEDI